MNATRAYMREQNRRYGPHLVRIPNPDWPLDAFSVGHLPSEVWRSRQYLVVIWQQGDYERLSVNRTELVAGSVNRFKEDISWEDLQRLKAECGRGECWCVEIYPADHHLVNVQNMRHLFVLKDAPEYAWKQGER